MVERVRLAALGIAGGLVGLVLFTLSGTYTASVRDAHAARSQTHALQSQVHDLRSQVRTAMRDGPDTAPAAGSPVTARPTRRAVVHRAPSTTPNGPPDTSSPRPPTATTAVTGSTLPVPVTVCVPASGCLILESSRRPAPSSTPWWPVALATVAVVVGGVRWWRRPWW